MSILMISSLKVMKTLPAVENISLTQKSHFPIGETRHAALIKATVLRLDRQDSLALRNTARAVSGVHLRE